ncbi:MAG TPA: hypothetical protein VJY15_25435 [Candidatus Acidoferrum sp.]|nr:hypothetical protein [Candidatus Acidoferrum sp.]
MASLLTSTLAIAQTPPKPTAKKTTTHRANELTLAGLRPGRDRLDRAVHRYRDYHKNDPTDSAHDAQTTWLDPCRKQLLAIDFDAEKKIQVVRAGAVNLTADCLAVPPSPWKTGHGLRLGDPAARVAQLYGEPDSRSPSTKDGQPLELWYYAFDWAGPDVPQVMEVLCTKEKDGEPGRVVEITLAAPSL